AEAEDKAGVSGRWKYVLECSEIATAMAWRALCRSAWTGKIDEKTLDTAITCSRNLALVCNVTGEIHFRLRLKIYRQAIRLATNDSSLHRYLAMEYSENKRSRAAILEFEHAARLFPSAANWLTLSQQYASNGRKQEARDAIEEASNLAWGVEVTTLGEIEKQAGILGVKASEASLYKLHWELDKEHNPKPKETEEECAKRLEGRLQNEAPTIRGRLRVRIGELLASRDTQSAKQYLQQGIEELEKAVPVSDRHPFFHELLSNAYRLSGNHEQALVRATRAVALEPLQARWRQLLANVLVALEDYENAEQEWRTAHNLAPSDPGPLRGIAQSYWMRGVYFPQQRSAAFQRVVEFFQDELSIIAQQPMTEGGSKKNIEQRALVHYWLGRFYTELNSYDDALSHLKISLALGFKPLETRVALGDAYLAYCLNNEAEDFFAAALRTARTLRRSVGRVDRPADANGEDQPIAQWLVYSHTGLATSFADRSIRLQNARRHVHYAARYLKHVGKSEQVMLLALERDIRGWVQLRTDPLGNQHITEAITELQCSLALRADPQTHYHLAEAYLAHALAHPLARASSLSKARENSVLARQLDFRGNLQKRLDELVARIDAASVA
ncbi:MAG TPA: hypothetical protein VEX68_23390, partial [Bryobacteraceae bacterium]|nr:hypothetical protein [Bryobacteraceae bacterium]